MSEDFKKYGVVRDDTDLCDVCGEVLQKINGKLICLHCDQLEKYGSTKKVKIEPVVKKWK